MIHAQIKASFRPPVTLAILVAISRSQDRVGTAGQRIEALATDKDDPWQDVRCNHLDGFLHGSRLSKLLL
jgi:hypothetical protein